MDTIYKIFQQFKRVTLTLITLLLFTPLLYSQLQVSSVGSTEITVNGDYGVFDVIITNDYSTTQEDVDIELILPDGITYSSGSISSSSGHVVTETNPSSGMFSLASIAAGQIATVTFEVIANCDAIDYQIFTF